MTDWLYEHAPLLLFCSIVLGVALFFGGFLWYYQAHDCHGDGHYYWTTQCVTTGKSVICYPVQQEEVVCNK